MIRFATEKDLGRILEIYGPYITEATTSFEYEVPSLEEFTERFRQIVKQYPWLVYEEDGVILGYAYGGPTFARAAYQWSAEASIYLCPEACGRGIGKKLYATLERILQLQGYRKVYAIITTANESSIAFHRAVGYRYTATMSDCGYKHGQWYGTVWMEKDLNTWDAPPREPIPAHRVLCDTENGAASLSD